MRPDIKKLITVFLIASALVSSSALIVINLDAPSVPQAPVANKEERAVPKNAFVEPLPVDSLSNNSIANNPITNLPSSNLTENLASNLAQEIVRVNPNGPQTLNGNPSIAAPDVNAVSAQFTKAAAAQLAKIPDWESDAARLTVTEAPKDDEGAATAYFTAANAVMTKLGKRIGITDETSPVSIDDPGDVEIGRAHV